MLLSHCSFSSRVPSSRPEWRLHKHHQADCWQVKRNSSSELPTFLSIWLFSTRYRNHLLGVWVSFPGPGPIISSAVSQTDRWMWRWCAAVSPTWCRRDVRASPAATPPVSTSHKPEPECWLWYCAAIGSVSSWWTPATLQPSRTAWTACSLDVVADSLAPWGNLLKGF